jgi:hypothetical protein
MHKQVVVYPCNEISALKRKEILRHNTTWMRFEVNMLSEIKPVTKG